MHKNKPGRAFWRRTLLALLLGSGVSLALAQDEGGAGKPLIKPRPSEILPLTPKSLLLDIVRNDGRLFAVGERGAIIVSANGRDWAQVQVPVRATLTAIAFADARNGWAGGHDASILHTSDGGRSWTLQNFKPDLEKPVLDLLALDAQHAIAVGAYGLMLSTADGGQTWNEVDTLGFDPDELHLNAIAKLANGDLFVAGEQGLLAYSTDQGQTWTKQESPYEGSFFGVLPRGASGALIYGLRGNVYVSEDARSGKWTALDTGTVDSMFGGAQLGERDVLVGLNGAILVVAADGSVQRLRAEAGTPLSGIVGVNGNEVLAVGESGVQGVKLSAHP
ncbi:Uncharacterized protein SAMN04488038_103222 [Solimonas aquatica]|uniref:Photosynthesis system II assembly factor Ycf48/Hcf136-like domain-containing protein n=1 Tax=Solimonas aquatica TaxID=489703 RepID=A0A1H9CXR1_9GAMM|nr:YCF48-related protein [Solimonas aquatica]SEQ05929.1 Uncharacterized protein SAMN04488038_103222 [Solimonas aquatica]